MPQTLPYGAWKSPLKADQVVRSGVGLQGIGLDGDDIYWTEGRPTEQGRTVVVRRRPNGQVQDLTPSDFNVRSRVHEYGGGPFQVRDGVLVFSNFADGRVYRQDITTQGASQPRPISPVGAFRYADFDIDVRRRRMICICEDHSVVGREPVNTLVAIDLEGPGQIQTLVQGNDFYANPRLSPDASRLTWLTWNHPHMPFERTELWVTDLNGDGTLGQARCVAGHSSESIFQPSWSPDGTLTFISDRSGWWNLYCWRADQPDATVEALCPMEAEFGLPQWQLDQSTYGFASAASIVCAYRQNGQDCLARLDLSTGVLSAIDLPYSCLFLMPPHGQACVRVSPDKVLFLASSPMTAPRVISLDLVTGQHIVLKISSDLTLDSGYISTPRQVEFPTTNEQTAYGLLYLPCNPDYRGPEDELPPLLVTVHGGPTGSTTAMFNPMLQYWTSRGFAVFDVNYGGSTGYGRAYRERLHGQWGVVDVDDCVNGARYLSERGLVDRHRLVITGPSAGGYTTLLALTQRATFAAGVSLYGVSDLETFVKETHKFEAHYLDWLLGPYPQARDVYVQRSPIRHVDRLSVPTLLFQGLDDKIVPPNQAEVIASALRKNGVPVAYVAFEGEGHGFRRGETQKRRLEAELYFYARVFGFPLAEPLEPLHIDNQSA